MGYYCTVPQCTSLAGKTKNVKFHRFPRDVTMADKWNHILKRGKPVTKYSKVCSLHFTQADYNVTSMGQWKTLSKDAIPSQNLPRLNPDGTVMVIRKSRSVKYRDVRKDSNNCDNKRSDEKWSVMSHSHVMSNAVPQDHSSDPNIAYRLQTLSAIASTLPPQTLPQQPIKPKKQDAFMQTDPINSEEDDSQPDNSYNEPVEPNYPSQVEYIGQKEYAGQKEYGNPHYQKEQEKYDSEKKYMPKDYTKPEDYIPRTNEEYNKEAEKYALERKSHNGFDKPIDYQKMQDYKSAQDVYFDKEYARNEYVGYQYSDSVEVLRNQQHNLEMLQQQHRVNENQNFFNENHIKQEIDMTDEDKYMFERAKEQMDGMYGHRNPVPHPRLLEHLQHQVKQEPDTSACDSVMQPQDSPYYTPGGHNNSTGPPYYEALPRPGPELLIAKQNALAAHSQLWQNTMKRPFFYSEPSHYSTLHRYEDLTRILQ